MFRRTLPLLSLSFGLLAGSIACEPEQGAVLPGTHPDTGMMAISPDGDSIYVALPDHDLVRRIDTESGQVLGEVTVPGYPHRVAVLDDGRVAVTSRYAGRLSVIDGTATKVESTADLAPDPFGVMQVGDEILVAESGNGTVARIDANDPTSVKSRVELDSPEPRGLARGTQGDVLVSHFRAGRLSSVDPDNGRVEGEVSLHLEKNEHFWPNQLESMTVSPEEDEVLVPHQECNNDPDQFGAGNLEGGAAAEYYATGPTGYPAMVPAVTRADPNGLQVVSKGPGELQTEIPEGVPDADGPASAVINPLNTTVLGDTRVSQPVAVALADGGRLQLVVNRGSGNVLIRRSTISNGQRSVLATVDVGVGAEAIVLSPAGDAAYVYNPQEHTVTRFEVPAQGAEAETDQASFARFMTQDEWDPLNTKPTRAIEPTYQVEVAEPVLDPDVERGRELFHSVQPELSQRGAASCASCHPGGQADGTTWQFGHGPRNTPALWGGVTETEPLHWDQAVTDTQALNEQTIKLRMGGLGLTYADMEAIGAYIDSIPVPAPPADLDPMSVDRGRALFNSDAVGCAECHMGEHYTDGLAHDVGTGTGFSTYSTETRLDFATPVLHGLAYTGPYLHDGSAQTLRDVVEKLVVTDRMGTGSHLTNSEIEDLVSFLESL